MQRLSHKMMQTRVWLVSGRKKKCCIKPGPKRLLCIMNTSFETVFTYANGNTNSGKRLNMKPRCKYEKRKKSKANPNELLERLCWYCTLRDWAAPVEVEEMHKGRRCCPTIECLLEPCCQRTPTNALVSLSQPSFTDRNSLFYSPSR